MEWIVAETQEEWLLRGFLFIVANALVMLLTLKSGLLFHRSSNSIEFEITHGGSSSISFPITPPPPAEAEANLLLVHYQEGFCTTTATAFLAGTNSNRKIDEKAEVEYDNGNKTSANVNKNCLQSKRLKMEMDRYELRRRADDFIAEFRKELRIQRDSSWQNLQSMYLRSC